MISQLTFKPCFRCEIIPPDSVFLLSEQNQFLLNGKGYVQLAPFLNGQYTIEEIFHYLQKQLSPPEIFYLLDNLRSKGYITEANSLIPSQQASFWSILNVSSEVIMQPNEIAVMSVGDIELTLFQKMLESMKIRISDQSKQWVVFTDDYLREELANLNQKALQQNCSWLLAKPVGTEIWIGPLFIPGKTGCWECLAHRLRGTRKVERYLQSQKKTTKIFPTSLSALPSTLQTAFGITATETAKWIIGGKNQHLESHIITFNTLTLTQHLHQLTHRPQCLSCGDPSEIANRQSNALILESRKKSFIHDGGHRSISPKITFEKISHHISPITGIVSSLQQTSTWENEKGNEKGLVPSYLTSYNFDYVNHDLSSLRESLRGGAYGKGYSHIQAKVSALCESIERYSGVFQGDEARITATFSNLSQQAIHPNACMLFSEQQLNQVHQNVQGFGFDWLPKPLDEDEEIEWSPIWSLTNHQLKYVATAYCYHGYSQRYNIQFTRADSNGCASGNNKEEAILQGFMELVERDCIALWWYNQLKKPAVNLASFNHPYFEELLAYYKTLARDLWVLDITSDFQIPAFAAISRRNDQAMENILLGFGAHFDPQIAILRALTELNQSLPAIFSEVAQSNYQYLYQDRDQAEVKWWHTATIENQPYLSPDETVPQKTQTNYSPYWSDDIYTDVMTCVKIANDKGLETLVLDQTRPDIGLNVVKVIVPGLRHFWPRFGPGRLYDIPVQMGWLSQPLSEPQLNPQPIFF